MYVPVFRGSPAGPIFRYWWFDRNGAHSSFDDHKRLFAVPDSAPLRQFESLVRSSRDCAIECSCKIEEGRLNPARFYLWRFDGEVEKHFAATMGFLRMVELESGVRLDDGLLRRFLDGRFDFDGVKNVVACVDLRESALQSRLKLFLRLAGCAEKLERAVSLLDDPDAVRRLMFHDDLLVGFDFHLDGGSGLKLYSGVTHDDLRRGDVRRRLQETCSPDVLAAIAACHRFEFQFKRGAAGRVLSFHPLDPGAFIERFLPTDAARHVYARYQGQALADVVVAVPEEEFGKEAPRDYSLYFIR